MYALDTYMIPLNHVLQLGTYKENLIMFLQLGNLGKGQQVLVLYVFHFFRKKRKKSNSCM